MPARAVPRKRTAALIYAATLMLMGVSITLGWRYLTAHPELVAEPARPALATGARRSLFGALAYLPAIALAPVSPAASFIITALIAVYFAASRSAVPGLVHHAAVTRDR